MSRSGGFHDRSFDDGTLTKLRLFQLYTREWLPVFLSKPDPSWKELHLYDFFAGPGTDSAGNPGSPLLFLEELRRVGSLPGWPRITVSAHFFDEDAGKVQVLREKAVAYSDALPSVSLEVERLHFAASFASARRVLARRDAAKLVLIDQFGVDFVSDDLFKELISFPTCDTLFFISSSTLHRFRDHPAIKQKIARPDDYYHVHRKVVDYYRTLIPPSVRYFLGGFSIKKGSNIYGVIFGSAHPLGMDKFLRVAWRADELNGEADFDINRDDCGPLLSNLLPPTKITAFESELASRIRSGLVKTEADVIAVCFEHGVKRQHSESVLKALKAEGTIDCGFRVPDLDRLKEPRTIQLVGKT
jgi:three-Cys-motif partner protein